MNNYFKGIVCGLALGFASTAAHAMSELVSVDVTPLWPTNSNPGNVTLYEVRIERQGSGLLEVNLNSASLPAGCIATFTEGSIRFTGHDPRYVYFTMAINGSCPTAVECCAFTVSGSARRESVTFTNIPNAALRLGPVPSQMVNIFGRSGGDIEIQGLGDTGQSYRIEASSSLLNPSWSSVGSCTADGNGRFTFFHTGTTKQGLGPRFYRAVKVVSGN